MTLMTLALCSFAKICTAGTNTGTTKRGYDPLPAPLEVRTEHFSNPPGITEPNPVFSYRLPVLGARLRGVRQTAYRVVVANVDTGQTVWDSQKTASNSTVRPSRSVSAR